MILDSFRLDGKVAIVTGVSRGLGQAMAIALAQAGADIVGVGISDSSETQHIITSIGRRYHSITADLVHSHCAADIVSEAVSELGQVDILVNNSGMIRRDDILEFSEQDWDEVMNLNLKTLFFLAQEVAKQFERQGHGGKIVNIGSVLSYQGGLKVPSYVASKFGVKGLTMSMANELAPKRINVNAIAPGYMVTDVTTDLRRDEKRNASILERIPAGRWGQPNDLAGAVVFLASSASNYVNGATLAIDGGWLAR
jgi:2-deoxy-D-gluconate 3-dehydrogenase